MPIVLAIADDHEIFRKGVIEIISSWDEFSVTIEANDGKDLIHRIAKANTQPNICIIDINMPEMNGYDTLAEIKKQWPKIKVMVLTMLKDEYCFIKMIRNGADGFLSKNSNPKELRKALLSIHESGVYHSDLMARKFIRVMQETDVIPKFSDKELELLKLCASDLTYAQIADKMSITERSVAGYRDNLFHKLNVNSRVGLAMCAIKMGIVPID
ncbi:MAG: response regulator transcription factor [Bacteroidetes bacterium]|nr:response regulator transcription factor [Bacteroidota bacterium]